MKYYHKILIVDDNKENLTLVGNILDNQKYNIALATSGKQALAILEDDKFELILLDIMMPEMDGFEVCKS